MIQHARRNDLILAEVPGAGLALRVRAPGATIPPEAVP
jgi:hypothetical protein